MSIILSRSGERSKDLRTTAGVAELHIKESDDGSNARTFIPANLFQAQKREVLSPLT